MKRCDRAFAGRLACLLVSTTWVTACGGGDSEDNKRYAVGGTVAGLMGTVVLQNRGTDDLAVTSPGRFTFATPVRIGRPYEVTVTSQPAGQACNVVHGTGNVSGEVTDVVVTCFDNATHALGGSVTGLVGTVVLRNGTETLSVAASGAFVFADRISEGIAYSVSVATQPTGQACSVANASGIMPTTDVTDVTVTCVDDPPPPATYSIGGTVSGLGAGNTLQLGLQHAGSLGTSIEVTSNGTFSFDPERVAAGDTYAVSIVTQPAGQTCSLTNDSGTANADVTNVEVACVTPTTTYSVGGTIAGLNGLGLRIESGAANVVTPEPGATTFTLPAEFENGGAYDVGIAAQPAGQTCLITRSQGAITDADVSSVLVSCIDNVTSPLSGTFTAPALSAADSSYIYLTLFPDGVFIYAGIENTNGCGNSADGNGIEYGVYSYDATTGAFAIRAVAVDTNGGCGVWHNNSRFDGTLTVTGSGQSTILALDLSGRDTLQLVPVGSIAGQLYGSFTDAYRRNFWLFLDAGGGGVYFLDTETQADPAATSGPVAGLEYACGAINGTATSGTLTREFGATCFAPAPAVDGPVDTNGTSGLSHHVEAWEFSVDGDAMTSSTFNGSRVVPH